MTRIKICGISRVEHALAVSQAGADYIGLVFARSRRRVSLGKAREISEAVHALNPRPAVVGVFVDETPGEVSRAAELCGLDCIQLSGSENLEEFSEIGRPVIKVIHILPEDSLERVLVEIDRGYKADLSKGLIYLLDSKVGEAQGGSGQTFDWSLAAGVAARYPVMVAGGVDPHNVGGLVTEVQPWGVDVSSGVETRGRKDILKIAAFIQAVRKGDGDVSAAA